MSTPPGQNWPPGQQPWGQQRPPAQQQPHPLQVGRPLPPATYGQQNPVSRPSIWRIAIGVWLGLILFFITIFVIAVVLAAAGVQDLHYYYNSLGAASSVIHL